MEREGTQSHKML